MKDLSEFEKAVDDFFFTYGDTEVIDEDKGIIGDDIFVYKHRDRKNNDAFSFRIEHGRELAPHLRHDQPRMHGDINAVAEERLEPINPTDIYDFHSIGELLRDIHDAGARFSTGDRLKYAYDNKWKDWHNVLSEDKSPLARGAYQNRRRLYNEMESKIAAVDDTYWNTSQFCHRDFHLGNILKAEDRGYVATDWEFADEFYPGIEVARMATDISRSTQSDNMKYFLSGYINKNDSFDFYKSAVGQYANYLSFNPFPFDRDYSDEVKEQLNADRNSYIHELPKAANKLLHNASQALFEKNRNL